MQAEIKNHLASLRRENCLRWRRRKKDQARSSFFNDPLRFMKNLFTQEKSGKLISSKEDLKTQLKEIHSDINQQDLMVLPPHMPPLPSPPYQPDASPGWSKVKHNCALCKSCIFSQA